ncbi:MAG: amidohydrolase [Leucobacter sp.]
MPQTLYTHPNILTLDQKGADAFLVESGTIAAIGPRAELRKAFPASHEVALPGAAIVPGFHDAHIHTGMVARDLASIDLRGSRGLEEALGRIYAYLAAHPGDEWVTSGYWDSNDWATGVPTRHDLDAVCADRPIALSTLDGHSLWVNSLGLRLAGIDASTEDPEGGLVLRESNGREPAGVLRENAMNAVNRVSERRPDPKFDGLLERAQDHLLALGLTHLTDFDDEETRLGFTGLRDTGKLKLRVHKGIPMGDLDRAIAESWRTGEGDRWITTGPVKLFSDGALGSHSAHMIHDFADAPGNHGVAATAQAELSEHVRLANAAGIAVATHAIGDRANQIVLDVYAEHAALTLNAGLRNRIEHAQHIDRVDLQRFVDLGVVASMQPTHCTTDFRLAGRRIGSRDIANYPWRTLLELGAHVAFGSDAPIEPANPLYGVHAAVTRQNRDGDPVGGFEPNERVSVEAALRLFSHGAAFAAGLEHSVGRIAVGQYADVVALTADPYSIEPTEIKATGVAATVIDGEIVYAAS